MESSICQARKDLLKVTEIILYEQVLLCNRTFYPKANCIDGFSEYFKTYKEISQQIYDCDQKHV